MKRLINTQGEVLKNKIEELSMESNVEEKGLLFRRRYETAENQPVICIDSAIHSLSIFRRAYSNTQHASGGLQSVALPDLKSGHEKRQPQQELHDQNATQQPYVSPVSKYPSR
ncbi:hypothetical protein [Citrobacter portucalensis]